MDQERRELSTADLARPTEASDRAVDNPREAGPPPSPDLGYAHPDTGSNGRVMLFGHDESERLRTQWGDIQAGFVDAPRAAVERADALVAETMKRMAEMFATERANLEQQWDRGDNVTTEDLRVALQRYRAFFDRLLSV